MLRRFLLSLMLVAFPAILVGCPGEDPTLGESIDEGVEEVADEVDDAF